MRLIDVVIISVVMASDYTVKVCKITRTSMVPL